MKFILKKLCITYGTIKKISKYFDKNILLLLYNSLIISHIRYGIGTKTTVQKIQRIVNKFNRMIFGLRHRASVTNSVFFKLWLEEPLSNFEKPLIFFLLFLSILSFVYTIVVAIAVPAQKILGGQ